LFVVLVWWLAMRNKSKKTFLKIDNITEQILSASKKVGKMAKQKSPSCNIFAPKPKNKTKTPKRKTKEATH
jgi:hypothetical protein